MYPNEYRPTILIVDDNPINLQILADTLHNDYKINVATNGATALKIANHPEASPDLILLDIMMPVMDGYEVCRQLKQNPATVDIPVIFVTAKTEIIDEELGLSLGAVDYILKPIKTGIVLHRIRNTLEQTRMRKEIAAHRDHLETLVKERTTALLVAKDAAEAASRAKSTFLANMSHELRTPLNGILGMTAVIMRHNREPKLLEQLGKVEMAAKHLLHIINDILDISKIEADRLTLESSPFRIGQVLENLSSLVSSQIRGKGLRFLIKLEPGLPSFLLMGDQNRLGQILLNLVSNAIKFTEHGSIALNARITEDQPEGLCVRWEITDTGIGIPLENQQRLFNVFEQMDNSLARKYGGTGLGLAISKRLVNMMGGELGVISEVNRGSTFWFTTRLQRAQPEDLTADETFTDLENKLRNDFAGARILLVEDEPINQEVSRIMLEEAGLNVDLAEDGAIAVQLASTIPYALILMDMQMPNLNGLAATRAIRANSINRHVPILAMTANGYESDRQHCLEAGMNDHIVKPVDTCQLYATLLKWLQVQKNETQLYDKLLISQLRNLADLHVDNGLALIHGNEKKYIHILRLFLSGHSDDIEQLKSLLGAGDFVTARQLAHALKGVAGNLGANTLSQLASELEQALKQSDLPLAQTLLKMLDNHMHPFLMELSLIMGTSSPISSNTAVPPTIAPSQQQQALLQQLETLLDHDEMSAQHLLASGKAIIEPLLGSENMRTLETLIARFDYEQASALLSELKLTAQTLEP